MKRAAILIKELTGGRIASDIIDVYPRPIKPWNISLRYKQLDRLTGQVIDREMAKSILKDLDIKILEENDRGLELEIPTFKVDVTREADLIEEVLRVYGYNQIDIDDQIHSSISYSQKPDPDKIINLVSEFLVAKGFTETMNNSLSKADYYIESDAFDEEKSVKILNPLSSELNVLRQSLLFGGLESIERNIKFKRSDIQIFEFGNQYRFDNPDAEEVTKRYIQEKHLALFISGNKTSESWAKKQEPVNFFDLKDIFRQLLHKLGINSMDLKLEESQDKVFSYALTFKKKKSIIAVIGKLSHKLLSKFDIEQEVFYADINWDNLFELLKKYKSTYKEVPKYPAVRRDLALLIDKSVSFDEIQAVAKHVERKLLRAVNLFDVYEGKGIPEGKKSYAVSFILQDENKTLTDKLIDKTMNKISRQLEKELGASLR